MKYIKTKDGKILKGSNYGFGVGMPYKNYDVKVADTIEELCDEFVLVITPNDNDGEQWGMLMSYDDLKYLKKYPANGYYGAIWTDKGLIYVAKMNEKGELELL